MKSHMQLPMCG